MMTRCRKLLVLSAIIAMIFFIVKNDNTAAGARSDQVAAITYAPVPGNVAKNRQQLGGLIAQAAERGARYIVLPELSLTGPFSNRPGKTPDASLEETIPGPSTAYFAEYAKRYKVWIAFSVAEKAQATSGHYITTVLVDDSGAILQKYRKVIPRSNGEDGAGVIRGSSRDVLESLSDQERRIGILSGDDIQIGVPRLADRGADTILIAANWSAQDPINWVEICQQLSREYRVNLVIANHGANRAGDGLSAVFASDGNILRSGSSQISEQILTAPLAMRAAGLKIDTPSGLSPIPFPTYYPVNEDVIELGRALFFDKNLSSDKKISCGSCHQPARAFADGLAKGVGVSGKKTDRNVPSLLNVAYRGLMFWDGFASTLENQAKYPMSHVAEMNFHYLDATAYVRSRPEYGAMFRRAFNTEDIKFEHIARALSSYQRTLVSGDSPFDRYYYGGDETALTPGAKRGLKLFLGKANCVACHKVGNKDALFMDQEFHNTGIAYNRARRDFSDAGFGEIGYEGKSGLFLTPSLRNAADTAPYMHDGSISTLREVVEFYNAGGIKNPYLDPLVKPLNLTREERANLVDFLYSLNGSARYSEEGRRIEQAEPDASLGQGEATSFAAMEFTPAPGNLDQNRKELIALIERAARDKARFVVLPEHALTGSPSEWNVSSAQAGRLIRSLRKESFEEFSKLSKKLGIWIALPVLEYDSERNGYFVTTLLLDDKGQLAAEQRKLSAKDEWGDGNALKGDFRFLRSIETPVGRIGILSGDDILSGIPRLAGRGAATVLVSASWKPSDVIDWFEESIRLARQYKVNLVISNLKEPGSGDYTALILNSGKVIKETSSAASEVFVAALPRHREPLKIEPPLGLPSVPQPTYSPLTKESVELGRKLFFDGNLSRDGKVSCATCHDPRHGFADQKKLAEGVFGRAGKKNSPTLLNSAYRVFQSWEGHVESPESQVGHALHGYAEMDMTVDEALAYLKSSPEYRKAFRAVTSREIITFDDVSSSIANYQRTLVAGNSPFDRYYFLGETRAISEKARRGLDIFLKKANCASCHNLTPSYALFTDNDFHNTGVGYHKRFDYLGYSGHGIEGNQATKNRFRGEYLTPSLRNIALTRPYMHDGSLATLKDVVRFYDQGAIKNPFLDSRIKPLGLTEEERESLVAFLMTLTSDRVPAAGGLAAVSSDRSHKH